MTDQLAQLFEADAAVLTGVLAHELGHVQHRHGMRMVVQASAIGLVSSLVLGDFSTVLAGAPVLLGQQSYSRDAEREADAYSAAVLKAAGLSPAVMVGFFEKMNATRSASWKIGRCTTAAAPVCSALQSPRTPPTPSALRSFAPLPPSPDTNLRSIVQEWASRSALCGPSPLRALQALRECRWPGVRSPAHARGAPDVVHGAQRLQRRPGAQRARPPRMGPAPVPRTTCPGTPVAPRHVAGHLRLKQGGGGAPGRRLHSRCHGSSRAWIVMTRLAVAGLGGAPRAWAGERGRRHRPGAQSLGAGLARTDRFRSKPRASCPPAQAGMRAAANGRKGPTADSNSSEIEREVV